jgi:hypothetical protein
MEVPSGGNTFAGRCPRGMTHPIPEQAGSGALGAWVILDGVEPNEHCLNPDGMRHEMGRARNGSVRASGCVVRPTVTAARPLSARWTSSTNRLDPRRDFPAWVAPAPYAYLAAQQARKDHSDKPSGVIEKPVTPTLTPALAVALLPVVGRASMLPLILSHSRNKRTGAMIFCRDVLAPICTRQPRT